jgi:hypothetical protein
MTEDMTPPEVNGESSEAPATYEKDPTVVGSLTEMESNAIGMLRRQGQQMQMEIGGIEIHKARLVGNILDLEAQAHRILTEAGKRLGIPEGQPWTVNPDGSIRMVPGKDPAQG